jgi:hypothetical protein
MPMRMQLQSQDGSFSALFQPIASDEEFVLFPLDTRLVCGASQTSLLMFGVRITPATAPAGVCTVWNGQGVRLFLVFPMLSLLLWLPGDGCAAGW